MCKEMASPAENLGTVEILVMAYTANASATLVLQNSWCTVITGGSNSFLG